MKIATTKQRILQYLENKGISKPKFFEETKIKRGFLDADKLNQAVSDENLAKIIAKYPEISPDWLLTGKGEMLRCGKAPTTPLPDDNPLSHSSEKDLNALVTVIDRQSQQIERLIAIIETITNKK